MSLQLLHFVSVTPSQHKALSGLMTSDAISSYFPRLNDLSKAPGEYSLTGTDAFTLLAIIEQHDHNIPADETVELYSFHLHICDVFRIPAGFAQVG